MNDRLNVEISYIRKLFVSHTKHRCNLSAHARDLSLIEGKWRILKELCCFGFQEDKRFSFFPIAHLSYGNDSGGSYFFGDHVLSHVLCMQYAFLLHSFSD